MMTALVGSQRLPSSYERTSAGVSHGRLQSNPSLIQLNYLSGITISRWLVSTTKTASSFAGAAVLAFWLTW